MKKSYLSVSALSLSLHLTLFLGLSMAVQHPTWSPYEEVIDPFTSGYSRRTTTDDGTEPGGLYSDYVPATDRSASEFSQKPIAVPSTPDRHQYYSRYDHPDMTTAETADSDSTYYYFLRRKMAKQLRLCFETIPFPDCAEAPNKCNEECSFKFSQASIFAACHSASLCRCEIRC